MTLAMHTGNHEKVVLEDSIVDAVRELRQEYATGLSMNDGVSLRMLLDGCHSHIESATERLAQAWPLLLVPCECLFNFGFSRRREEGRLHRGFRRSRTSDQGRPSGRPARISSSRAS